MTMKKLILRCFDARIDDSSVDMSTLPDDVQEVVYDHFAIASAEAAARNSEAVLLAATAAATVLTRYLEKADPNAESEVTAVIMPPPWLAGPLETALRKCGITPAYPLITETWEEWIKGGDIRLRQVKQVVGLIEGAVGIPLDPAY